MATYITINNGDHMICDGEDLCKVWGINSLEADGDVSAVGISSVGVQVFDFEPQHYRDAIRGNIALYVFCERESAMAFAGWH